jgi:hypothetical protein
MGNHLEVIIQNDRWSLSIELVAKYIPPRGRFLLLYPCVISSPCSVLLDVHRYLCMELDMEKELYRACYSVIGLDLTKSTESLPACLCLQK